MNRSSFINLKNQVAVSIRNFIQKLKQVDQIIEAQVGEFINWLEEEREREKFS